MSKAMHGPAGEYREVETEQDEKDLRNVGWIDGRENAENLKAQQEANDPIKASADNQNNLSDVKATMAEIGTKAELVDWARGQFGIELDQNDSRADLEKAIRAEAKKQTQEQKAA